MEEVIQLKLVKIKRVGRMSRGGVLGNPLTLMRTRTTCLRWTLVGKTARICISLREMVQFKFLRAELSLLDLVEDQKHHQENILVYIMGPLPIRLRWLTETTIQDWAITPLVKTQDRIPTRMPRYKLQTILTLESKDLNSIVNWEDKSWLMQAQTKLTMAIKDPPLPKTIIPLLISILEGTKADKLTIRWEEALTTILRYQTTTMADNSKV